jgi:hypothetical protein
VKIRTAEYFLGWLPLRGVFMNADASARPRAMRHALVCVFFVALFSGFTLPSVTVNGPAT